MMIILVILSMIFSNQENLSRDLSQIRSEVSKDIAEVSNEVSKGLVNVEKQIKKEKEVVLNSLRLIKRSIRRRLGLEEMRKGRFKKQNREDCEKNGTGSLLQVTSKENVYSLVESDIAKK